MATTYNTLQLDAGVEKKRGSVKYVLLGFVVVALAGAAGFLASSASGVHSSVNAAYLAENSDVPTCKSDTEGFLDKLPKYDPGYSSSDMEFYNACYYSFRCCSTTSNSDGCYVSDSFGEKCRGCIAQNGPRMTRGKCTDWLYYYGPGAATSESGVEWSEADMLNDNGFPDTKVPDFYIAFLNMPVKSCWVQAGPEDARMSEYSNKCFEVISWCNLLCPRDTPKSTDHKMCKQCTLFGFANKDTGVGF